MVLRGWQTQVDRRPLDNPFGLSLRDWWFSSSWIAKVHVLYLIRSAETERKYSSLSSGSVQIRIHLEFNVFFIRMYN